jgi:uncharacterized membrane protein
MTARPEILQRPAAWGTAPLIGALGVALFVASWITIHYGFFARGQVRDTPLYEYYGDATVHGYLPYRDFGVDYPPGALPAFVIPSLWAGPSHFSRYQQLFDVEMALCGAVIVRLVGFVLERLNASTARIATGVAIAATAPLLLGSIMLSRYDLWPAMVTAGALAALVAGRARIAFALLGLAIAVKLYAGILVPVAVAYVWRRRGRREALVCAAALAAVLVACFGPFLVLAPHGLSDSLVRESSRPLQIETLGSSVLLAAHQVAGTTVTVTTSYRSQNLVGSIPDLLATLQTVAQAILLILILTRFLRRPPEPEALVLACAASVCAFVAFGKVLSPQFIVWLIPLVPMLRGPRSLRAGFLFVAVMVLTQVLVPHRYFKLVFDLAATETWLLVARNLLLVILAAVLLWPERARASARTRTASRAT